MTVLLILTFLLIIPAIMWKAWVLHSLWVWFLVPVGVPEISGMQCFGLSLLITLMITKGITKKDIEDDTLESWLLTVFNSFGLPAVCLFMGWVVQRFI